jgi:hypothetical protein
MSSFFLASDDATPWVDWYMLKRHGAALGISPAKHGISKPASSNSGSGNRQCWMVAHMKRVDDMSTREAMGTN